MSDSYTKRCKTCGTELTADEIALNRKMIDRYGTKFLCKTCFAEYFGVSTAKVDEKIEQFKRQGCLLFTTDSK